MANQLSLLRQLRTRRLAPLRLSVKRRQPRRRPLGPPSARDQRSGAVVHSVSHLPFKGSDRPSQHHQYRHQRQPRQQTLALGLSLHLVTQQRHHHNKADSARSVARRRRMNSAERRYGIICCYRWKRWVRMHEQHSRRINSSWQRFHLYRRLWLVGKERSPSRCFDAERNRALRCITEVTVSYLASQDLDI